MNLRNVLRAYSLLRQLSDDESALLNILRALNDSDREQLVASMSAKPAKKSTKKPAGKGGGGDRCSHVYGSGVTCNLMPAATVHVSTNHIDHHPFQSSKKLSKSARGESLKGRLDKTLQGQRKAASVDDNEDNERCTYKLGKDAGGPVICSTTVDNNVHHKQTDPDYHPFQPSAASTGKSDAQSAAGGS